VLFEQFIKLFFKLLLGQVLFGLLLHPVSDVCELFFLNCELLVLFFNSCNLLGVERLNLMMMLFVHTFNNNHLFLAFLNKAFNYVIVLVDVLNRIWNSFIIFLLLDLVLLIENVDFCLKSLIIFHKKFGTILNLKDRNFSVNSFSLDFFFITRHAIIFERNGVRKMIFCNLLGKFNMIRSIVFKCHFGSTLT